jgi:tRNA threonylcarbamoyladenosine biosynthesis protein TsaB
MRVLAIDTALEACAAAVLDTTAGAIIASESQSMARGHAEALMPLIARVMDAGALEFSQLDRIAVTVGPGSFTGLRVGIAAARGIALTAAKPAVGLSTLSAFAAPHVAGGAHETIIVAIDARHEQVYFQVFGPGGRTVVTPRLDKAETVAHTEVIGAALVVGSGAELVAAKWPPGLTPPRVAASRAPEIGWIARLGAAADQNQAMPKPLYLRRPDARPQDAARLPRK